MTKTNTTDMARTRRAKKHRKAKNYKTLARQPYCRVPLVHRLLQIQSAVAAMFLVMSVVEDLFVPSNSSFLSVIYLSLEHFVTVLRDTFHALTFSGASDHLEESHGHLDCFEQLSFDELQIKLLKGFLFILFCNIILILFTWKVYGKRISNRFMRTATSKAIEDLKKSVSMLKLPKEHSPRI